MKLSDFDFSLPDALIAQTPSEHRDRSRLMVVDRSSGIIEECEFKEIKAYLHPGDLMVLNNTKVFPARILGKKGETGGRVEALLVHQQEKGAWVCMLRGKVHPGQRITFVKDTLEGEVIRKEGDGKWLIRFACEGDLLDALHKHGQIPLPPYIKRDHPAPEDRERYQTVYAQHTGAVAAPTAGLHFTDALLRGLRIQGLDIAYVTLHVGPGTFKPVREGEIEKHKMDEEAFIISPNDLQKIKKAKEEGRRLIAVGTTTTRTLETLYLKGPPQGPNAEGWSGLFIIPGFTFKAVDALVTNFHLPRSTLLLLVCAFAGYDLIMKAYKQAIEKGFRFYSYGDAMFII